MGWFKEMIRNWLDIIPADNRSITINEPLSFETEVIRNKIWYRGDAYDWNSCISRSALDTVKAQGFGRQCRKLKTSEKFTAGFRQ